MCVFLVFSGIGAYWTHLGQTLFLNEQRFFMSELVNSQASAFERRLSRSLSSTSILAQGVFEHRGPIPNFDDYANSVLESVGGVSNLQLAPKGIISFIYPLEGNEKALGHDVLADDARSKEALLAVKTKMLTLAGPFELIQGGIAVIGRKPIYLPARKGDVFWGFASALIYLEELLKATELDSLEAKGYSYQLFRIHPDTGDKNVFAKSVSNLTDDTYMVSIQVPNADWTLEMSRSEPVKNSRAVIGYIISVIVGFFAAWIAFYILEQPKKLRKVVYQKTRELNFQANNDELTGLYNRRYLSEQLERVLKENTRYHHPAALMYMDLDNFKRVNDVMGHGAGDELLKQIAIRLKEAVRESDIVTRLGGDEFGILLLDSESVSDARRIAEKLMHVVERPVYLNGKPFEVSLSIGITMIPTDGDDNETILKNADMAMYSAKKTGKRNFRFYNAALQREAIQKLELENDLYVAVCEDQFIVHYQPIFSLSTGKISSYEALLRWNHPHLGLIYPDQFICVAEESGSIIEVGYWVIQEVCNQIKKSASNYKFSINLSPKQFQDPRLINKFRSIIQTSDIDASLLEVEITESSVIEDSTAAIKMLLKLKKLGISIALDDFGTGYSSLSVLKRLPIDRLKIDKSFIQDIEQESDDRNIVEGVISMAHKLRLNIVVEGIETKNQLKFVKEVECDYGQGYFCGKPAPFDQL